MEEPVEPSVLEYARFYGLTRDYLASNPLESDCFPEIPGDISVGFEDSKELLQLKPPLPYVVQEKLLADKNAALLLGSLRRPPPKEAEHTSYLPDRKRWKRLKTELPILRTENELDMRDFTAPVVPDLAKLNIPFERVDEEKGEGLTWPSVLRQFPKQFHEDARREKLAVPKEALLYLQDLLKALPNEDDESTASACLMHKKVRY